MTICFVDVETTALDRDLLQVWEVALITDAAGEQVWHLPVDLSRADPKSLGMNGFVDRYNNWDTPAEERPYILADFAQEFARATRGLTLAGTNPAFDERALWKLLRENGECPLWHYRTVCVEALAAGYLVGQFTAIQECGANPDADGPTQEEAMRAIPPWNSNDLSLAVGVDPGDFDRHAALGDARWAKAIYQAVMGR